MSETDEIRRAQALWLLLLPILEENARTFGASPRTVGMALTMGLPSYILSASKRGEEYFELELSLRVFRETARLLLEGRE